MDEEKRKKLEEIDDPNYEEISIAKFGLAAIRGMGWSEKDGIGLTNKRTSSMVEPELRPKGLGLGAGFSKKPRNDNDSEKESDNKKHDDNLKYVKGAYIQVVNGKYRDEYGTLIGFDDGLDRILVKLYKSDQTVSLIQTATKVVSKHQYKQATEKK